MAQEPQSVFVIRGDIQAGEHHSGTTHTDANSIQAALRTWLLVTCGRCERTRHRGSKSPTNGVWPPGPDREARLPGVSAKAKLLLDRPLTGVAALRIPVCKY